MEVKIDLSFDIDKESQDLYSVYGVTCDVVEV